jgi:phage terminase large subunit-like protein
MPIRPEDKGKAERRISDAEKYLRDVLSGRIVACKRIKQLAEMMLPRFEHGYKRWHFDIEKALKPVRFIERFCCSPESGKLLVLEPYEKAVIQIAFGFVDDDGYRQFQEVLVLWARKNGKALSLNTPIPTPDGWKLMKDIHPGDYVFGKNGKPVKVLFESEVFYKPMYRVYFEDGATINASEDHVWTVQTRGSRRQAKNGKYDSYCEHRIDDDGWFDVTTQEIAESDICHKRADGKGVEYRYRVPMCKPVEYAEADLPIDPYLLGVWLGDGTSEDNDITVGEADLEEMLEYLKDHNPVVKRFDTERAPHIRVGNTFFVGGGNSAPRRHNDVKDALRELGLLKNKHIPEQYLTASVEQRWELLKGLMDTDGYCSKKGQCQFVQKSRNIAMQLAQLCASLGIKATVHEKRVKCNGKDAGIAYSVLFFTDKEHTCFKLERKTARLKDNLASRMLAKSIVKIERIPNQPSKCIAVDDPSHLYLAGKRYTTTHNSSLGAAIEIYMLVADGEGAPQVYNVANSKAQASLAYGICLKMVRRSKDLNGVLRKGTVPDRDQDGIIFDRNDGYITVLTNQTRNLDGLNIHFVLFDEMHANTNRDQYDLCKQAMTSETRKQPLLLAITTNGFERNGLFDDQYDYGCGVLEGTIIDDTFLPFLYELDDRSEWTDERCWIKPNPGLDTVKSRNKLRNNVNKGMQDPSFMPTLMTKDFNMPESRAAAWLAFEEAVNEAPLPELPPSGKYSDVGFRYGVGGFDASDTTDLSAGKFLMMRRDDPNIYELSMYWLPEEALKKGDGYRRERDDVPYRQWEERGLLRTVPGNTVPKRVFVEWLEEIKQNYDVWTFAIGYDPWHVLGTDEEQLQQYTGKDLCEKVRQGPQTLSMPGKELRAQFAANVIVDGHNPVNEWCRMNVQVSTDNNANIKFHKVSGKAVNRIDGFMAELCAYVAYLRHKEEYEGVI